MAYPRPMIAHAEGVYLYDTDGKRYLDAAGGPLVINVGHGRTEVVQAMAEQAQTAAYTHAIMFTSQAAEDYAEALAKIVPLPNARFFPMTSGSEVVEAAIKLSRQIQMARGEQQRTHIISRQQSYHGMSLGALSASGRAGLRAPYLDMMKTGTHVSPPYTYRDTRTGEEYAAELEQTILSLGAQNVAAFLAEPISGASLGGALPPADYWGSVRAVCDRYGVLWIADEVLVGFGRTGKWWGHQHWNATPDIIVTSKGAAGGYFPLGWVAAKGSDVDLISKTLGDFNHGGTFSHHPVGMAAGLAVLGILQREQLVENAARVGAYLGEQLHAQLDQHSHVGNIRGRGLFWGIEWVQDKASKQPFDVSRKLAPTLWQAAFEHGVSLYYSQGCADGKHGDLILIGPPLIAQPSHIDEILTALQLAMADVFGK
jgi:adenosylmethionine-8-amino-7-oxononanoate aminotransferase